MSSSNDPIDHTPEWNEPPATEITEGSESACEKRDLDSKQESSCLDPATPAITSCLQHDTDAAGRFLDLAYPGYRYLVAIHPETRKVAACRHGHNLSLAPWLANHADWNIYFTVNEPMASYPGDKKCAKGDIHVARFLHVDVDPRAGEDFEAERERILALLTDNLPEGVKPPTCVIDSGGGFQALWLLREPLVVGGNAEALAAVEGCSRWLERRLGADNCHNIDRVLRLPGTVNRPDARKRAKGRVAAMARLVLWEPDRAYDLDDFALVPADAPSSRLAPVVVSDTVRRLSSVDELPEAVPDRIKVIIVQGRHPDEGPKQGDDSRSAWLFDALCGMARAGCDDDTIFAVVTDPDFGVSASVLDNGAKANAYALRQIAKAREAVAKDVPRSERSGHPRWVAVREVKATGELVPVPSFENTRIAIRALGVETRHDVFHDRKLVGGHAIGRHVGELSDAACLYLRSLIFEAFGWEPKKMDVNDAVVSLCIEGRFDPVRDYLDGLEWDGTPRLDAFAPIYLLTDDDALNRAIGRKTLIAAVRRVRQPGCKFDYVPVLEGPQGCGKSTAVRILAGDDNFSDKGILHLEDRAQQEAMKGVWLYELAELAGLSKRDTNRLKAFLSQQDDRGRAAYERFSVSDKRRGIFVGTTNDSEYLIDPTGNRRFWPMVVGDIDLFALRRDRDQLWAEAAKAESDGEPLVLPEHLWGAMEERQRQRLQGGDWAEVLATLKPMLVGNEERMTAEECYRKLDIPASRLNDYRIGTHLERAMASLGFKRRKIRVGPRTVWGFVRPVRQPELPF
jgi:hypothetical protein